MIRARDIRSSLRDSNEKQPRKKTSRLGGISPGFFDDISQLSYGGGLRSGGFMTRSDDGSKLPLPHFAIVMHSFAYTVAKQAFDCIIGNHIAFTGG
jgi:hypothetical protein